MRQRGSILVLALSLLAGLAAGCGDSGGKGAANPKISGNAPPVKKMTPAGAPKPN